MSSFTDDLDIRIQADGKCGQLLQEFDYHIGAESSPDIIHVPKGFVTDMTSVPEITTPIVILGAVAVYVLGSIWETEKLQHLAFIFLLIIGLLSLFRKYALYSKAAVIHDYLYQSKLRSRAIADVVFVEAMTVLGVPVWRRTLMFIGVRLFGWLGYSKNNLPATTQRGRA